MSPFVLFLAAQLLTTGLHVLHPRFWVWLDVQAIKKDGSKQSLTYTFHRQRALWRFLVTMVLGIVAALGAYKLGSPSFVWAGVCSVLFGFVYFFVDFNPRLNLARKEDYVGRWHVSWAEGSSSVDRYIWERAWERTHPGEPLQHLPDPATVVTAGKMLESLTTALFWASVGIQTVGTLAALLVA